MEKNDDKIEEIIKNMKPEDIIIDEKEEKSLIEEIERMKTYGSQWRKKISSKSKKIFSPLKIATTATLTFSLYILISGAPFLLSRHYEKKCIVYGNKVTLYHKVCPNPEIVRGHKLEDQCNELTEGKIEEYEELACIYFQKSEKWDKWSKRLDPLKLYHPKQLEPAIAGAPG